MSRLTNGLVENSFLPGVIPLQGCLNLQHTLEDASLEFKEIKQIVELMNKHELSYFHLERDDFCLKLKKGLDPEALRALMSSMPAAVAVPGYGSPAAHGPIPSAVVTDGQGAEEDETEGGIVIKAPMVGTFYRAASEGTEPFVKVGQEVSEDTTVCLIEAMKTFNEIKAEKAGIVVKICVENAQPVQYDDPLFILKPI